MLNVSRTRLREIEPLLVQRAKRAAETLMEERGMSRSKALEMVAEAAGYRSWNAMSGAAHKPIPDGLLSAEKLADLMGPNNGPWFAPEDMSGFRPQLRFIFCEPQRTAAFCQAISQRFRAHHHGVAQTAEELIRIVSSLPADGNHAVFFTEQASVDAGMWLTDHFKHTKIMTEKVSRECSLLSARAHMFLVVTAHDDTTRGSSNPYEQAGNRINNNSHLHTCFWDSPRGPALMGAAGRAGEKVRWQRVSEILNDPSDPHHPALRLSRDAPENRLIIVHSKSLGPETMFAMLDVTMARQIGKNFACPHDPYPVHHYAPVISRIGNPAESLVWTDRMVELIEGSTSMGVIAAQATDALHAVNAVRIVHPIMRDKPTVSIEIKPSYDETWWASGDFQEWEPGLASSPKSMISRRSWPSRKNLKDETPDAQERRIMAIRQSDRKPVRILPQGPDGAFSAEEVRDALIEYWGRLTPSFLPKKLGGKAVRFVSRPERADQAIAQASRILGYPVYRTPQDALSLPDGSLRILTVSLDDYVRDRREKYSSLSDDVMIFIMTDDLLPNKRDDWRFLIEGEIYDTQDGLVCNPLYRVFEELHEKPAKNPGNLSAEHMNAVWNLHPEGDLIVFSPDYGVETYAMADSMCHLRSMGFRERFPETYNPRINITQRESVQGPLMARSLLNETLSADKILKVFPAQAEDHEGAIAVVRQKNPLFSGEKGLITVHIGPPENGERKGRVLSLRQW